MKPKKLDHLNLGPAAGEGLPDRLQCRGCANFVPSDESLCFYLHEFRVSLVRNNLFTGLILSCICYRKYKCIFQQIVKNYSVDFLVGFFDDFLN